ncbi:MAG: electron transfer flavoprotein subunit alpha/FixB family protein, partial [Chitinophagia bacterium]|nr:electron transfer flavoprotein subunit alpha/FixB family protein [Chitinophagia bacterium]
MVLVLVEHAQGSFKKKSLEAVQYGAAIAGKTGASVTAVAVGDISATEMQQLGQYGATKVLHVADSRLNNFSSKAYSKVMIAAAGKEGATVVIGLHDTTGKAVMPRVAARL